MVSNDLTIIFLTANRVPKGWADFQKEKLLEAANGLPIITLSQEPLDWGINVLQSEPYGPSNIYFQLLKGAKIAETTFIAVAEDDVLYPREHFEYRPPLDTFAYNMNRFNVFAWSRHPVYSWKNRMGNFTLVAPRDLVIQALEERFMKYPKGTGKITGELGRKNVDQKFGLTPHKSAWFTTEISVIHVDHEFGIDRLAREHRKGLGTLRAYDIPYWGQAEDIIKKFRN